ncbi:hypothetical protein L0156_16510 [bacterium]|nr:hypothetical protein [bacterium]
MPGHKKTPDFLVEAKKYLEQLLNEEPPPPLQRACNYLGADRKCLRRHFPELCKRINLNFQAFYRGLSMQDSFHDRAKSYLEKAVAEIPPPSFSYVCRTLTSSRAALLRRFPELVSELTEKSKAYRKRNLESIEHELKQALKTDPPPALFAISKRLGVYITTLENRFPHLSRAIVERRKRYFSSKLVSIDELLRVLEEYPPPSVSAIANRFQCRPDSLSYRFPSIVKTIASNHRQHQKLHSEQLKSQFREELTKVVLEIIAEGNVPTNNAVYARMKGVKCRAMICETLREVLNTL